MIAVVPTWPEFTLTDHVVTILQFLWRLDFPIHTP